ncbi:MAG: hypothetical protein ABJF23_08665 [Bryobacteraceae bacterium]
MNKKHDGLRNVSAEPGKVVWNLNTDFQLITENKSFTILAHTPDRALKSFLVIASEFHAAVTTILEIKDFTRVGLRITYRRDYPDLQAATDALLATNMIRVPEGKYFSLSSSPKLADVSLRWEEKARGVHFRLRAEGREFNFEPPFGWEGTPAARVEKLSLACDCDFFTTIVTTVSQFSLVDWINQSLHMMNRDISFFLGAK